MFSGILTFGECLKTWMEEKGLTPPDLAAYTRETRDATIARMMHDQLDYQRCARFITELAESYPDIDEETLRRLRVAVDVNRYGKELYLAKQNFSRMILGKSKEPLKKPVETGNEELSSAVGGLSLGSRWGRIHRIT